MAKKSGKKQGFILQGYYPFILLLPLLLLPPFFRGLFFDRELLIAHIYTALVLVAYVYHKRDSFRISINFMEIAFVGLVVSFFLSTFVAYNVRDGVGEFLKLFNYFLVFFLLSRLLVDLVKMRLAIFFMFLSGVGVALAGIGTGYGTFWFNGAFVDGLINSTLQYHNGAAIYLMACAILGLYLAASTEEQWKRLAFSGTNFLILITAFGAGSRGAMLMGPIAFVLFFIGLPQGWRGKAFLSLVSISIPFAVLSQLILDFSGSALPWLFLFLGIVLAAGIQYGLEVLFSKIKINIDGKKLWIVLTASFLVIGTVVFIFSDQILPPTISERLHNFDMQQNSVQERFTFYKDATKIIKDHPVLGTGGGGWNTVYRQYQNYLYHSTEVHNHPLQVWVEAGTIGFVFLVLLWVSGLITIIKIIRSGLEMEYKAISWTAFCTAIALALHSLIDFSLSEGAISILLWSQFAFIKAVENRLDNSPKVIELKSSARKIIGTIVGVLFFICSVILFLGNQYEVKASDAMRYGKLQQARGYLEKAVKYDPMESRLRIQLTQVYSYLAQQNNNSYLRNSAFTQAKKAVELNPTSENYLLAAQAAGGVGNISAMIKHAEQALEFAPLRQGNYLNLAMVYLNAGKMYLNSGQLDLAETFLRKIDVIPEQMEQIMDTQSEFEKSLWKGPHLGVDDKFKKIQEEAHLILEKR